MDAAVPLIVNRAFLWEAPKEKADSEADLIPFPAHWERGLFTASI